MNSRDFRSRNQQRVWGVLYFLYYLSWWLTENSSKTDQATEEENDHSDTSRARNSRNKLPSVEMWSTQIETVSSSLKWENGFSVLHWTWGGFVDKEMILPLISMIFPYSFVGKSKWTMQISTLSLAKKRWSYPKLQFDTLKVNNVPAKLIDSLLAFTKWSQFSSFRIKMRSLGMTHTRSVPSVMGLLGARRLVFLPAVSLTGWKAAWLLSQSFSKGVLDNVVFNYF